MKKPLLLPLLLIVFAVFAPSSAYPGSGKYKLKSPTPVPVYRTTIGSISTDSITVNSTDGKTTTYKITPLTEMYYEGKKVAADVLKSGMRVTVDAGLTPGVATAIRASAPPTATSTPTKPKK